MSVPLFIVDAFAEQRFEGNPAAVCLLGRPAASEWMQKVAAELNLSETAFLVPGQETFELRWFTPKMEVDLCGHATLASAHVLWSVTGEPNSNALRFSTRSGILSARLDGDWIRMDFPNDPPRRCDPPAGFEAALGEDVVWFGRGRDYEFAEVSSETRLRNLTPDFAGLRQLIPVGVCLTARADASEHDFVSRFFAPSAGIDEDPVTGSAHCCLAPYWSERLGKSEMVGYQASARGGRVRVACRGDRVEVSGRAKLVVSGALLDDTES